MREIKFRGKTPDGETVYGDLTHCNGNVFIDDRRVNPATVQQFCGLDLAGDEVYEDDIVVAYGKEYEVQLCANYGLYKNLKRAVKKIEK